MNTEANRQAWMAHERQDLLRRIGALARALGDEGAHLRNVELILRRLKITDNYTSWALAKCKLQALAEDIDTLCDRLGQHGRCAETLAHSMAGSESMNTGEDVDD